MRLMTNMKFRSIAVIALAIIIGLGVTIGAKCSLRVAEQERLSYLNNKEAQYIARYGHPEITKQLNRQFDETVIPAMVNGANDFFEALTNPVNALAKSEEGRMCLNILSEFSITPPAK